MLRLALASTRRAGTLVPLIVIVLAAAGACTAPAGTPPTTPPDGAAPIANASTPAAEAPPAPITKSVRVEPVSGFVGDGFRVAVDGLAAGATVDWQWVTWEGAYETRLSGRDVLFMQRQYQEKRVSLGRATVDASGRAEATLRAPRDYGEVHNLYAVVDGRDVARGGFRILRRATVSPAEGPVGTPITIEVTGMAWKPFESTMALRYDNTYTGFVSAVTTSGAAAFRIRAAGAVGTHTLMLTAASPGLPFLNNQQSGTAHIPNLDLKLPFTVTGGAPAAAPSTEWPDAARATMLARAGAPRPRFERDVTAALQPATTNVGERTTLRAAGLAPSARAQVLWARAGQDEPNLPPAFREQSSVLAEVTTAPDGSLSVPLDVTGDRGGWHTVTVVQGGKPQAELPFYVRRSLASIAPQRVRAGEEFTVEIKGGGWTELDKGVAVTYDNSYIGYACSVTSGGDITIRLTATGALGTHLIDLYPMLYRQPGAHPPEYWNFELPQLTALDDHPGLARGYELPIFRLAIEVIP